MEKTAHDALVGRIAALERRLSSGGGQARVARRPMTARQQVLAEISALERRIAADADDAADDVPVVAGTEEDEADFDDDADVTASETAPGIEDEITQDRFHEVEDLRHGKELATSPSTADAAGYTARLKEASARLDRVASYLEKHGRNKLAFRIDRIADAIDKQVEDAETTEEA